MYIELKENKTHGTKEFPYIDYHIYDVKKPFQIPVHWHDEFEIIYVKKGSLQVSIEGINYEAKEHEIFLVNPGELHLMGAEKTGVDYHTFVFPLKLISFQTDDELESTFFSPLRNKQIKFSNRINPEIKSKEMISCLENLSLLNKIETSNQISIRIELLKFFQILKTTSLLQKSQTLLNTKDREILSYLEENFTKQISLKDISQRFNFSEKYLSRYFRQKFRINLVHYINHLRIKKATNLLETTDHPITEIAFLSGFQDVSYFVRSFHNSTGKSPLQYRKAICSKN